MNYDDVATSALDEYILPRTAQVENQFLNLKSILYLFSVLITLLRSAHPSDVIRGSELNQILGVGSTGIPVVL